MASPSSHPVSVASAASSTDMDLRKVLKSMYTYTLLCWHSISRINQHALHYLRHTATSTSSRLVR